MKFALTALIAVAGSLVPAEMAQAGDQRLNEPCVSSREFRSTHVQTREALERRWEVVGLGRQRSTPMYGTVVAYPRCGHLMTESWVGIDYAQRGAHQLAIGVVVYTVLAAEEPAQPAAVPAGPPQVVPCDDNC